MCFGFKFIYISVDVGEHSRDVYKRMYYSNSIMSYIRCVWDVICELSYRSDKCDFDVMKVAT